jgi:hypothetical protein
LSSSSSSSGFFLVGVLVFILGESHIFASVRTAPCGPLPSRESELDKDLALALTH